MKNLLNLTDAYALSKKEQQSINGGGAANCISFNRCLTASDCLSLTASPKGNCEFNCYVVVGDDDGVCVAINP